MKAKKWIIIIIASIVLIAAILILVALNFFGTPSFYCKVPEKMVGTYEEFVEAGKNLPADSMAAGVNVNGLEGKVSTTWARGYLTDLNTYMNIKQQGFDHIRFPVNFNFYYSEKDKKLIDEKMAIVDTVIDLAEKAGLYVQLDFHGWWEFNVADSQQRENFLTIWELVARRYSERSELLSFDLINEPPIATVSAYDLNLLQAEAISRIRKTNPTRLILCAAADGNQPWMLGELSLPKDDNIAIAVHIYHPADFTHQGFVWAGREKGKQVRLTDSMMGELEWNLEETRKFIEKSGYKVYLNEFGLNLKLCDPKDRATYLRRITEWCKDNDVPWTFWGYGNQEMALFHDENWRSDVLDDLFLR